MAANGPPPTEDLTASGLLRGVESDAVLLAMEECDSEGEPTFLEKYGFGPSTRYRIQHGEQSYPSKAILGAAVGYQFPDRGPLSHHEFSGGLEQTVATLNRLGFAVDDSSRPTAWMVRAGKDGEAEAFALEHGLAVIGWSMLRSFEGLSFDEIRSDLEAVEPDSSDGSIASQVGQIRTFRDEIADGDVVVLPLKTHDRHVAIGVVTGGYVHRPDGVLLDATHARPVAWKSPGVPYAEFDDALAAKFGLQGTVRG